MRSFVLERHRSQSRDPNQNFTFGLVACSWGGRCISLLRTSRKRLLVPGERETGRRERAALGRKTEYVNTNTFPVVLFFFSFNETFVHIAGSIGDIIKARQTGKLENARNVFWETSFEYRLLQTAVSRLKSLEMDLDTFPTNYK